jgi:hypothetical protein
MSASPSAQIALALQAQEGFARVYDWWSLSPQEAAALTGLPVAEVLSRRVLAQETLPPNVHERMSLLISIYNQLQRIHLKPVADLWMRQPNTEDAMFEGKTPLAFLLADGGPPRHMRRLHSYLVRNTPASCSSMI